MAAPEQLEILKKGSFEWNKWRNEHPHTHIDLSRTYLVEMSLKGAQLSHANLSETNLQGANLDKTDFGGADLENANLSESHSLSANFHGANLRKADLSKAKCIAANFRGANLEETILTGANLAGANFAGANLIRANLKNADLLGAKLNGAELYKANLSEANLSDTNFNGAKVTAVIYSTNTLQKKFLGIRASACYGNQFFKSFAQDQNYVENFRQTRHWIWFWLWYISADCGRSFFRWAFWSLVIAVVFGFVYFGLGDSHIKPAILEPDLVTMMYYSVVTFTTLGFGDITPISRVGILVVMIEVTIGYLMLGGLISILANKVARRS